jgi:hypothetical protein
MSNYAIEIIKVATPAGVKSFITNRADYRSDECLAKEVPPYFEFERKLGPGHYFISRSYFGSGLTKEQGEEGLAGLLAVMALLGMPTLNAKNAPGKNRRKLELIAA